MKSLQKMTVGLGIAVFVIAAIVILWSSTLTGSSLQISPVADLPGMVTVTMGLNYDPATGKMAKTVFRIPIEEALKQPTWNPATDEPPMPLSELKKIAFKNSLGSDETAWATWKVTNVEFSRLSGNELGQEKDRQDRWACEMTLTNQDPAHYDFKTVCILLDGTFVPAKPLEETQ
jgi:hypothetical protein